ncbi:glycosyltransferase family 4 protein [Bradyrhizobium sp. CB1650]|uniref:glycosyltransferase family 4 protein n=1 Tax=Bradyrhizobium sp. CB1650 TaxID=3039153 RepID=UPI0024357B8F|nr:glycosyltransferase family 4 protein [Bradyrhizobium sp. CB1650]WGD55370.1 glycosyltransferase family 4 protein [Bradyrhizobium sp. CB1650]
MQQSNPIVFETCVGGGRKVGRLSTMIVRLRVQQMRRAGKILVATQHYPPDASTTGVYVGAIAEALAADRDVVVLSGSPNSAREGQGNAPKLMVVELRNPSPPKRALVLRAAAVSFFALRMFLSVLWRTKANDLVFCVSTPFTLPYAAVLAARLRGAASALLVYDLYPEALVAARMVTRTSVTVRILRFLNARLFRALDAIITIGRDVKPLLTAYDGVSPEKIHFIANWALLPIGYREMKPDSPFRAGRNAKLVVGLSGNLGFTHDPDTVFQAACLLKDDDRIHFLLSGWGAGWSALQARQNAEGLSNVTLIEPVAEHQLAEFLAAADLWIIPYRAGMLGVSVPSRLYNLLAVGRPIIAIAEPESEAALIVEEAGIGWVVPPERPQDLANAILSAAADPAVTARMGRKAAVSAETHTARQALSSYRKVISAAHAQHRGSR